MAGRPRMAAAIVAIALSVGTQAAPMRALPALASVPAPGIIATFAGGGLATGIAIQIPQSPIGLAIHGTTLYIADRDHSVIRALNTATGIESIVAGNGTEGTTGDEGLATAAEIDRIGSLAVDAAGNLYFTQFDRVRKVTTAGIISTVAGGGTGDLGDGGPATSASIAEPAGVALDASGNLFVSDSAHERVRKVDTNGVITTVAGTGTSGYNGDGIAATTAQLDWPAGVWVDAAGTTLWIADRFNNRIREVAAGIINTVAGTGVVGFSGDGGLATAATMSGPSGLSLNAGGDIFITDTNNARVRVVDHASLKISTVAAGLAAPVSAIQDGSGNLYIADYNARRVLRIDPAGTITTAAGTGDTCGLNGDGGQANAAVICSADALILDASGNVFFSDVWNSTVRKIAANGVITTVAGNGIQGSSGDGGSATSAKLFAPRGLAFDTSGDLFIADTNNGVVREVAPDGTITRFAGTTGVQGFSGDGGPATSAELNHPGGIAIDSGGNVLIADWWNQRIRKVTSDGNISTVAGVGICNTGTNGDGGPASQACVEYPTDLAFDGSGNLYVAANHNLRRIDSGGTITTVLFDYLHFFRHVAVGPAGRVVASLDDGRVVLASATGAIVVAGYNGGTFGGFTGDGGPSTQAAMGPLGVAVDAAGDIYIADAGNSRLRRVQAFVPPSPPAGVTATAGYESATVHWSAPADAGGLSIYQYTVTPYAGAVAGPPVTVLGSVTSVVVNGLTVGAPYTFTVAASNGWFGGPDSAATAPVTPMPFAAPAKPTGVTANAAGYNAAQVQWTAPAIDGGKAITEYSVTPFSGATAGTPVTVAGSPPATSALMTGLAGGPYTFKVRATNAIGTGPASAPSSPVTPGRLTAPGTIITHAGTAGAGAAVAIGQVPYSLGLAGGHLYVGDIANPVVRDIDVSTGHEAALAGNDAFGYSGDGGLAPAARISAAGAIANCGPGLTYFADTFNYVIRRIDASGHITTVAGTGQSGYSGDGGPATSAQISRVLGLACRSDGGLYIADSDNGAVRILDRFGYISTWWYGFRFPTGIVEMGGINDFVAVSDSSASAVWQLSDYGASVIAGTGAAGYNGDGGLAKLAKLSDPRGLAWSAGLYIADSGNNRIRLVDDASGPGTISTVAGVGSRGFSGDGGLAVQAQLDDPTDVKTDGTTLWVADSLNNRVRKFVRWGGISTVAGNGTPSLSGDGGQAALAQLGSPFAVAVDAAGNQYVADEQNSAIRKIDLSGVITTLAGTGVAGFSGDNGPAAGAELDSPHGVAVDAAGNVFIADTGNERVRKVDHLTGTITTIAGNGTAGFSGDAGAAALARLNFPSAVAVDAGGDVYIADTKNNRIRIVTAGAIHTYAGNGAAGYAGDNGAATASKLNSPTGLAIDANGNVLISDSLNNRVRSVAIGSRVITTIAGSGSQGAAGDNGPATMAQLDFPVGLAAAPGGELFIADPGNQRVRMVDLRGVISTVVGLCGTVADFAGDGGIAALAHLNFPFGVAADQYGDVYVADVDNNRVRGAVGLAALGGGSRGPACQAPAATPGARGSSQAHGAAATRIAEGGAGVLSMAPGRAAPRGSLKAPSRPAKAAPGHKLVAAGKRVTGLAADAPPPLRIPADSGSPGSSRPAAKSVVPGGNLGSGSANGRLLLIAAFATLAVLLLASHRYWRRRRPDGRRRA